MNVPDTPSRSRVRRRAKQVAQKLNSPVWVVLGATKVVESLLTHASDAPVWAAYTGAVTFLWIVGVLVWDSVEDAADAAQDAVSDTVDSGGEA